MKKSWIGIGVVIMVALVITLVITQTTKEPQEIKIGAMLALTGDYAPWGERSQRGIELALEEVNEEAVGERKIRIIYEDSPGDPQKAVSAFRKLVELDNVKFILGPLSSAETLSIAPIAESKRIVVLTPVSSAPQISYAGDYIFRNCVSDVFEGRVAAEYIIKSLQKKKGGVLYVNNDFGIGVKTSFSETFGDLGGVVVVEEVFSAGDTDFRTQLSKIKSKNPEVIVLAGYAAEMAQVLRQAKELGMNIQFFSFSSFEAPEILNVAQEASEGILYTYQGFDAENEKEVVSEFVEKYRMRYKEDPDIFAALSYDALKIFAEALKKGDKDVEKVKKALYGIKDFVGVAGKTSFDEHGDVIKPIGIKKVEHGKFIWLYKEFEIKRGDK